MLAAQFVISEFMTDNDLFLLDGDGQSPDWIEIHNPGTEEANLEGWYLTDQADEPTKWQFPNVEISPGGHLVVFASATGEVDYVDPAGNLHTNFQLNRTGEYLALVQPDGATLASEFKFHQQFENVSYGVTRERSEIDLIGEDVRSRWLVPQDDALSLSWTQTDFDDESWNPGTSSLGYADEVQGLSFWLNADHIHGLRSGDPVSIWSDASGKQQHAVQSESQLQPTWIDNAIGDRAALRFDGIDDLLSIPGLTIEGDTTIFIAAQNSPQAEAGESPHYLLTANNNADRRDGNGYGIGYGHGRSAGIEAILGRGDGGVSRQVLSGRANPTGNFEIVSYWKANSFGVLRRDRDVVASDVQFDPAGGYTTGYSLGGDPVAEGHAYQGDIAEILVFDRALSNDEREAVLAYLEESYFDATPAVSPTVDLHSARIAGLVQTDTRSEMLGIDEAGVNASIYVRQSFEVKAASDVDSLALRTHYDDGFIAYLNGQEIARRNVHSAAWNSAASIERTANEPPFFEEVRIVNASQLLKDGVNVLAIHGQNASAADSDFLLQVELLTTLETISGPRFYVQPTPGFANRQGINNSGPAITDVQHLPARPAENEDLVVSARIVAGADAIYSVNMTYRVQYGDEQEISMRDDGQGGDAIAGDSIFAATIPATSFATGQMIRYYISTKDQVGNPARKPEFLLPTRSAQYFGTVVIDPDIPNTKLPVLEWFVEDPLWYRSGNQNNRDYTFASIFYDGEFYDNIRVRVRGGVTVDQAKPNLKLDFYSGGRYVYDRDFPSVEEMNLQSLMGEISTRTYMRNPLAYQVFRDAGHAAPNSIYTHVRQNGQFYGLYAQEEQIDATFLERYGFDPEGALYKSQTNAMLQLDPQPTQWNKATRLHEDFTDLATFTEGLVLADPEERARFVFDQINIPQVIHYLAITLLGPNHDRLTHNYFVYRDTNGTQEWSIFPWDLDRWFPQGDLLTNPTAATIFYGDSDHPRWPGTPADRYNRLNDAIFDVPETREMFVAHLRSVVDQWMNNSYLEDSVDAIADLIELDAGLDNSKWSIGSVNAGVRSIKSTIATRREQLASMPELTKAGTTFVGFNIPASIFIPADETLGNEWTTASYVEGSRGETWSAGNMSVGFGSRYSALFETNLEDEMRDQRQSVFLRSRFDYDGFDIDELLLRIHYDDAFVAHLNGVEIARSDNLSQGENVSIDADVNRSHSGSNMVEFDVSAFKDRLIVGENVLAIHGLNVSASNSDLLIRPELIGVSEFDVSKAKIQFDEFDVAPESNNQDEEFVSIVNHENRAIDISAWKIQGGIQFEFQPGTVIPANGRIYLSPNVAAFRQRSLGPTGGQGLFVQGNYQGHLSNRGEAIELIDVNGNLVTTLETPDISSDVQKYLRITELHYNPPGDDDATEFIEIRNVSDSVSLDLIGVRITDGPSEPFDFSTSRITELAPGAFALVVKNAEHFLAAYPDVNPALIAGEYLGSLRNSGETIKIEDATGATVLEFRYEDGRDPDEQDWPTNADGEGFSLIIRDDLGPVEQWATGSGWAASPTQGGTPGRPNNSASDADFDNDGDVDADDIDLLSLAAAIGDTSFDLNNDGVTDEQDRTFLIESVLNTSFGDANLDGVFNSSDLVLVFQAGQYEDPIEGNSGWASGDWNGDGEFSTSDLVAAFQTGMYRFD
ncbi:MAG: lamin tail domain-containing protein [Planctomycetales bacterium]|nr:lamin tail domain-containing protein [Planctomycetales bacterium]